MSAKYIQAGIILACASLLYGDTETVQIPSVSSLAMIESNGEFDRKLIADCPLHKKAEVRKKIKKSNTCKVRKKGVNKPASESGNSCQVHGNSPHRPVTEGGNTCEIHGKPASDSATETANTCEIHGKPASDSATEVSITCEVHGTPPRESATEIVNTCEVHGIKVANTEVDPPAAEQAIETANPCEVHVMPAPEPAIAASNVSEVFENPDKSNDWADSCDVHGKPASRPKPEIAVVDYCEMHEKPVYVRMKDSYTSQANRPDSREMEFENVCSECFSSDSEEIFPDREGFCVVMEGLYWGVNYNLPFSISGPIVTTTPTSPNPLVSITQTTTNGSVVRTKNKWSPGFRAGIGAYPDYYNIDVQLIGTYYENHVLKSIGSNNFFNVSFNSADANFQIIYRVGDFELGKTFMAVSNVLLRPFCGVRGGWLDQNHHAHYLGTTSTTLTAGMSAGTIVTGLTPLTIHLDQDLWCVGPRLGLNTTWFKNCGFSILANISASMLYGKAHQKILFDMITNTLDVTMAIVDENVTDFFARDTYWEVFPTLQVLVGFSWEWFYRDCKNVPIKLYAGWEANFWWETSNIFLYERSISMQGVTGGLDFGF